MTTLDDAKTCIAIMKQRGQYEGQRIGSVERAFSSFANYYEKGEVILFKSGVTSDRVIVETPKTPEEIASQGEQGVLTLRPICGVPRDYIRKR